MTALLAVAVGGLVGAPARFVVDQWVSARTRGAFPWGTFMVNATGAFLLGLFSGLALPRLPVDLVDSGLLGSYTTFSTFSYETVRLVEEGDLRAALLNLSGSLLVGLLAAGAGLLVGTAL